MAVHPPHFNTAKVTLFVLALIPLARLAWGLSAGDLGPNPVETLQHKTGIWALNLLGFTLCITPLHQLTGQASLLRLRRMLGLFAFFYATLHALTYVVFDAGPELAQIASDILARRFLTAGVAAWLVMLPLALTSFNRAIRMLGGARWQALQRGVYLVAVLAVVHFYWLSKGTALLWPMGYALGLALLFAWRIGKAMRRHAA